MRKRFKISRICSSDNYEKSKRTHRKFLKMFHNENIEEIRTIVGICTQQKYYVQCFDKLIEVTEKEALVLEKSIKIIKK